MKYRFFITFLFYTFQTYAQVTSINFSLFENEVIIKDSIKIKVFVNNNYLDLLLKDSVLYLPDFLKGKKVDLYVATNKYNLKFYDLIIGWNSKNLMWLIYLDFPPFHRNWSVPGKLKNKKWVYAIDRGNGTTITYYGSKSLVKNPVLK